MDCMSQNSNDSFGLDCTKIYRFMFSLQINGLVIAWLSTQFPQNYMSVEVSLIEN